VSQHYAYNRDSTSFTVYSLILSRSGLSVDVHSRSGRADIENEEFTAINTYISSAYLET
jgi:hypothetical protein